MFQFQPYFRGGFVLLLLGLLSCTPNLSWAALAQSAAEDRQGATDGVPNTLVSQRSNNSGPLKLASAGDQEEFRELLAVLEEETEIATKTKMNQDYVPGIVTVLHREQLEALGISTVAEAMALVPGIQVARQESGSPTLKVRGFSQPFNAGNVKVMLNSIALSRESSGINSSVLLTPVAQVKRIEVIRGPGSIIYGDFALAGVVNIITNNEGGRAYGRTGDDQSKLVGGHYTHQDKEGDFKIGLNVSWADDAKSAAQKDTDPDEDRFTGIFNFGYKGFSLTAEGVNRALDQTLMGPPPLRKDDRFTIKEESWAIEGRQKIQLGQTANLEAHLTYLSNRWDADEPPADFKGDRVETGLDLKWAPWSNHQLLFAFSYATSDIDEAETPGPRNPQDPPGPGPNTTVVTGVTRRNYSFSLQDQVSLGDRFTFTLGLRFDHYNDVGSLFTPKIAAVYRLGEHHVLKAQYSEGFRAPTFWELYNTGSVNQGVNFEVMGTTEVSYVYRQPNMVGRLTLYHSKINDRISPGRGGLFNNDSEFESQGAEAEWEQRIGQKFRWLANLSYTDAWHPAPGKDSDQRVGGIANWLGNLAFFLRPFPRYMVTGRLLYVGDRYTREGWLDRYEIVDFTVSRMDLLTKGLTLRLGVKNLFDDTVIYIDERRDGVRLNGYQGRTFWVQLSYDF